MSDTPDFYRQLNKSRRKSHHMVTRLDKSLGFSASFDGDKENEYSHKPSDSPVFVTATTSTIEVGLPVSISGSRLTNQSQSLFNHNGRRSRLMPTVPKPFSFEAADRALLKRRQEMYQGDSRPPPTKCSTHSASFSSTRRHRLTIFEGHTPPLRARPASVLYRTPFAPLPVSRSPLVAISPEFATSARAAKHMAFKETLQKRRMSLLRSKEMEEKIRETNEKREIQLFRETLVHHPEPIRQYKPPIPKPPKPPTRPRSPQFSQRWQCSKNENWIA